MPSDVPYSLLHGFLRRILPAAVLLLTLGGCETTFEPFEESDLYFSVFGYLDGGAPAQFIRISPLRDTLYADPEKLDATVTLEHLATGQTIPLYDSTFTFPDGRVVHNFLTYEPMQPGATYRFTATRSDGAASRATVAVPEGFPDPLLDTGISPGSQTLPSQSMVISGVETLALLEIKYEVMGSGGKVDQIEVSYVSRARPSGGALVVGFDAYRDLQERIGDLGQCPTVVSATVRIASASPGWPNFEDFDEETLALPGSAGNIENGVGFLGGVYVKRVPWPALLGAMRILQEAYC